MEPYATVLGPSLQRWISRQRGALVLERVARIAKILTDDSFCLGYRDKELHVMRKFCSEQYHKGVAQRLEAEIFKCRAATGSMVSCTLICVFPWKCHQGFVMARRSSSAIRLHAGKQSHTFAFSLTQSSGVS